MGHSQELGYQTSQFVFEFRCSSFGLKLCFLCEKLAVLVAGAARRVFVSEAAQVAIAKPILAGAANLQTAKALLPIDRLVVDLMIVESSPYPKLVILDHWYEEVFSLQVLF